MANICIVNTPYRETRIACQPKAHSLPYNREINNHLKAYTPWI